MRISRVRVQNYKAIKDTGWVDLEENITTLIGKNESGKTSFLEAIHSFGRFDEYHEDEISDFVEDKSDKLPIISIEFKVEKIDRENVEELDKALGDSRTDKFRVTKYSNGDKEIETDAIDNIVYSKDDLGAELDEVMHVCDDILTSLNELNNQYKNNNSFNQFFKNYRENVQDHLVSLSDGEFDNIEQLIKELEILTENILALEGTGNEKIDNEKVKATEKLQGYKNLFDLEGLTEVKFFELLPKILYFEELDQIQDSVSDYSIDDEKHKTFKNLLELAGVEYEDFEDLDFKKRRRMIDRAETKVRGDINNLWQQKEIEVAIGYDDGTFSVLLQDNGDGDEVRRELVSPSDRSKGFQWFFSFYINFMHMTEDEDQEQATILLDDPAVFLHPDGKKDWLKAIEEISEQHQTLYTAHSPFLIDKKYPNRLRIFEDTSKGVKATSNLAETNESSLKPVRKALGIGLGDSPFVSKRKLLVEGASDYYIITGLLNYLRKEDEDIIGEDEVTILPVDGAPKMLQAVRWVDSEEFSFGIILDKDEEGGKAKNQILQTMDRVTEDNIIQWDNDMANNHMEIEDMFSPEFYVDCVNEAYRDKKELNFNFEPLVVEGNKDEVWDIEGVEYEGRVIASKIQKVFNTRGYGDLDKVLVAREIMEKLNDGNAPDEDIAKFKPYIGRLREITEVQ